MVYRRFRMVTIQCAESTGNGSANNEIHICSQVASDSLECLGREAIEPLL